MIIGISGKIGAGKDLVGTIIQYLTAEAKIDMVNQNQSIKIEQLLEGNFKNNSDWEIKKFAYKLKEVACLILGCTMEQIEDREWKETPLGPEWNLMTPRKFLQLLGTEAGRNILHENIWVNATMAEYRPISGEGAASLGDVIDYSDCEFPNWIITDVRFPNEAQAVKSRSGLLIRVNRGEGDTGSHPSETALDKYEDWDAVINNNGTIEDLVDTVHFILQEKELI